MTRILFMGTPAFSVPILRMLKEEGYDIVAAVTQPDRPVGRKKVLTPPPVKKEAERLGIPVLQPERVRNPDELQQVLALAPDLIITAAFGQILPKELLEAPELGAINVHASLLPEYRGGAPIHQAVIDGKEETGVTIMYMAEALDAGDIISQVTVPISDEDDTGSLFEKLSDAGRELLKETLPAIINGTNERIPQDASLATFARNITREQERIDWTKPARSVFNHVRGLHPWPVAYTVLDGQNVKVWQVAETDRQETGKPGDIIEATDEAIFVQTGAGVIAVKELQLAGKKRLPAKDYANHPKFKAGGHFE
ncbi:methionyl-tRNA formyltransferase [Planococcus lenghuensis]|uniref:Methionyl-tRNA formyltransferase n=1 Tax=Planococcus lenghuensis TaxID=2213202 RepID=A0A1Q2L149_9BACL|nr:methionyl-tRNA formyltransferase [Planococcus lenghuensis]AQQ53767.1 methionyl-tRNA formyltransferase [Planococcus lenghuensis]